MTARWGICVSLALVLALSAGCRTPQPVLKPPPEKETLTDPPDVAKYNTTGYPQEAFDKPSDPAKQAMESKLPGSSGMRGMTPGSAGMGGMGSR